MAALAYGGRVASPMTMVALRSIYSPVLETRVSLLTNHVSLLPVGGKKYSPMTMIVINFPQIILKYSCQSIKI